MPTPKKKLTPRQKVKATTRFIIGGSTAHVTVTVINNNLPDEEDTHSIRKAERLVGALVIGYIVQDYVGQYTDRKIDEAVVGWHNFKAEFKAKLQEAQALKEQ